MSGEVVVILECFGRSDDGFVSCASVENIILRIQPSDPWYQEMMDYFDGLQLFDRTLLEYNAVRHFIFNMQDKFGFSTRKLWSEKMFCLYQKFTLEHKDCGLCLRLAIPN